MALRRAAALLALLPVAFLQVGTPRLAKLSRRASVRDAEKKLVLVLSDASGETASRLLFGILAQFQGRELVEVRKASEVTSVDQLRLAIKEIADEGKDAMVLATLVDGKLAGWARTMCADAGLRFLEVMEPLLKDFGAFMEEESLGQPGGIDERKIQEILNKDFFGMVEAVKFGQQHGSGLNAKDWQQADVVLIGSDRVGKGPVTLQLALRGLKAAGCRVSSYERLPAEISGLKPQQVALLTMEEQRLLRVRQSKLKELKICKKPMLFEDDFATPSRVRSDLELMKQLQEQNPTWDHFDLTYLAPEDCASLLAHKVRAARDAAALRMD